MIDIIKLNDPSKIWFTSDIHGYHKNITYGESNWENKDLSDGQIKYATEDAAVVYDVINKLIEQYPFAMNVMPTYFQLKYSQK